MTELSDYELKEKLVSLFLTKDFEEKAKALDKKSKKPVKEEKNEKVVALDKTNSSFIVQKLIDEGLAIHEKDINNIFLQTIKDKLAVGSGGEAPKRSVPNHTVLTDERFEVNHRPAALNITPDLFVQSKNKVLLAEIEIQKKNEEKEKTSKRDDYKLRRPEFLDQAAKRFMTQVRNYADSSTLATAQRVRELEFHSQHHQTSMLGTTDLYSNSQVKNSLFHLRDIMPNYYQIVNLNNNQQQQSRDR